jgi:hypothetical protein
LIKRSPIIDIDTGNIIQERRKRYSELSLPSGWKYMNPKEAPVNVKFDNKGQVILWLKKQVTKKVYSRMFEGYLNQQSRANIYIYYSKERRRPFYVELKKSGWTPYHASFSSKEKAYAKANQLMRKIDSGEIK